MQCLKIPYEDVLSMTYSDKGSENMGSEQMLERVTAYYEEEGVENDSDGYVIGETDPGKFVKNPKKKDPDWFEKEVERLFSDEFKDVREECSRK
jgi:hypothetical protein